VENCPLYQPLLRSFSACIRQPDRCRKAAGTVGTAYEF